MWTKRLLKKKKVAPGSLGDFYGSVPSFRRLFSFTDAQGTTGSHEVSELKKRKYVCSAYNTMRPGLKTCLGGLVKCPQSGQSEGGII